MKMYREKVTVAVTIYLLGLSIIHDKANAATLFIGPNGSLVQNIDSINFLHDKDKLNSNNINSSNKSSNVKRRTIKQKSTSLVNTDSANIKTQESEEIDNLIDDIDAEKINKDISDKYYNLVEDDEQTSLIESNQLTKSILENEAISEMDSLEVLKENSETIKNLIGDETDISSSPNSDKNLENELIQNSTKGILLGIFLVGGVAALLTFKSLKSSEDKGIFGFIFNRFSKPQIPDKAIDLYRKNLKKISSLATRIEKMDDAKFKNREFITYLKLSNEIKQGNKKRNSIALSIEYLKVGILTQSSFVKLESTELRYRSIKQQSFYNFVAENITDDIDKIDFRRKVEEKLIEIKPFVNSEEGKNALQSYFNEIKKISQYDLGLKLLSLFKKYQLTDFTILRRVSDLVEQASGENLSADDNLKLVVLENYDTFKKLAPIIELDESEIEPQFFIKVLQYLGLARRYEKAFQDFQNLLKVIKKWEKPYDSLKIIRQQYSSSEYSLPKEFNQEIPGLKVYKKYQEHLEKNK